MNQAIRVVLMSACFLVGACTTPTTEPVSTALSVGAVIVKPRVVYESNDALIAAIRSKLANAERVEFQRPMSGGAYVFNVKSPASERDIPKVIADLVATGLFEYVEADSIVTINKK